DLCVPTSVSPPPPTSSLFPYTTLFRSRRVRRVRGACGQARRGGPAPALGRQRRRVHRPPVRGHGLDRPGYAGHGVSAVLRHRRRDRKSTRLNSSHVKISYAVFCLKKKK